MPPKASLTGVGFTSNRRNKLEPLTMESIILLLVLQDSQPSCAAQLSGLQLAQKAISVCDLSKSVKMIKPSWCATLHCQEANVFCAKEPSSSQSHL